jgi:hypothetical protein
VTACECGPPQTACETGAVAMRYGATVVALSVKPKGQVIGKFDRLLRDRRGGG